MLFFLAVLCFFSFSSVCRAHHPGIGTGTGLGTIGSPIITITPDTLPRCEWATGIQAQFIKFNSWSTETLIRKSEEHPDTDIETFDYTLQTSLFLSYGIFDHLMLSLSLPYISSTEIRHAEPLETDPDEIEVHDQGDSNGLGDLSLLFTWRFYQNDFCKTSAALLFGSTIPTGRTNIKDLHGERFAGDHQPGTGSFNPLVGIAVGKSWERGSFYSNIFYINRTKGPHHNCLGDLFNYNFALVHQFKFLPKTRYSSKNDDGHSHEHNQDDSHKHNHKHSSDPLYKKAEGILFALDVMLELVGMVEGKDTLEGHVNKNSGGHTLYLFPGLRILSGKKGLSCGYLSLGWPVYQDLNGSQTKSKLQVICGTILEF